jgi:ADP-heptose:LPS heptosyltransferase
VSIAAVKRLLVELGIAGPPHRGLPPKAPAAGASGAESAQAGSYLVFHPGTRWDTKKWPKQKWAKLADGVLKSGGLPIIFTGSGSDRALIEEILSGRDGLFNAAGRMGLVELSALLREAKLMVTVDSGPMHLAAAFSTPIVALFGPTSPARTGPLSGGPVELLTPGFDCAPCFERNCDHVSQCMDDITVSDVEAKVLGLLG